jgi:hypothetical protein
MSILIAESLSENGTAVFSVTYGLQVIEFGVETPDELSTYSLITIAMQDVCEAQLSLASAIQQAIEGRDEFEVQITLRSGPEEIENRVWQRLNWIHSVYSSLLTDEPRIQEFLDEIENEDELKSYTKLLTRIANYTEYTRSFTDIATEPVFKEFDLLTDEQFAKLFEAKSTSSKKTQCL